MIDKNLANKRQLWYSNKTILFNMLQDMRNREVVFLSREKDNFHIIRGLLFTHTDHLEKMMKQFNVVDYNLKIYVSCAKYKNIPIFPFNFKERNQATHKWFIEQAIKEIYDYDLLIDFDLDDVRQYPEVFNEVIVMFNLLKKNKFKFIYFPSGSGFQFIVFGTNFNWNNKFSRDDDKDSFNYKIRVFLDNLITKFRFPHVDLIGVGIYNKIRKCAYSLVGDRVVFPIHENNLNMNYNYYDSNNILKKEYLFNRGLPIINSNVDLEECQKSVEKFILDHYLFEDLELI